MKIGLFGGTFDPPHMGHLIAAQDVCTALSIDRFIFIPAALPPHKRDRGITPAAVRLEMLRAATAKNETFEIETIEMDRDGPSYTVDTLRELSARSPADELNLVIGVDQVREFDSWRDPHEILKLAKLIMMTRDGHDAADKAAPHVSRIVHVTRVDISSTLIRGRVAAGESIRYLVPDQVAAIIERDGLYR